MKRLALAAALLLSGFVDEPGSGPFRPAVRGTQTQLAPPPPPTPARPDFDSSSVNGSCVGAIPLLHHYSPGWDVHHMARIMHRESRCDPMALYPDRNVSTATGLLQLLWRTHCPWLVDALGEPCNEARLQDPHYNVRAAAELFRRQGMGAWAQTR